MYVYMYVTIALIIGDLIDLRYYVYIYITIALITGDL